MPDADLQRILADLRRRREQLEKLVFRRDDVKADEADVSEGSDQAGSTVPTDETPRNQLP